MKSVRMMVVDDSMLIRRQITRICDEGEFNIIAQAKNGNEAMELFVTHRPQIVTMDLTMPILDGIECTKNLIRLDPTIQILVISALSSREIGIEALQQGATGFLNKPFTEGQLQQALATVKQGVIQ